MLILAGLGMVFGNFIGGKIGDRLPPEKAVGAVLMGIVLCLLTVKLVAVNQPLALIMTFVTGVITFSLSTPIQLLMICSLRKLFPGIRLMKSTGEANRISGKVAIAFLLLYVASEN